MSESLHLHQIATVTGGKIYGDPDRLVSQIATDSRSLPGIDKVLFVAIRGDHHDGNSYIPDVYKQGVQSFLTDKEPAFSELPGATFCVVNDTLSALQKLAGARRNSFSGVVMAITGSNGKTIVKEWIYQLLQHEMSVVRSPRSYNSQLGVPLSLWQLTDRYRAAVIEAGISLPGEMEKLERIIRPDLGILTNIGPAHRENFDSASQKLTEKLKLFRNCRKLIYRADLLVDGKGIASFLRELECEPISWSYSEEAAYTYTFPEPGLEPEVVDLNRQGQHSKFVLPFTDEASVENQLHVITALSELGMEHGKINQLLAGLEPVEMRLETLKGIYGSTLVNDVYNSDLTGLSVALNVLIQQKKHSKKAVILSDVFQSGMDHGVLYGEVAELLKFKAIDRIYCIGKNISEQWSRFPENTRFYSDTGNFLQEFDPREIEDFAVLIKGARKFHFEEITRILQMQVHKTVLEINMNEMVGNLNYFRSLLKPSTKVMVMVKALSYGSGAHEIAESLQHEQVDYLAVAFPDEGVRLRMSGVQLPVMVMNADMDDYRTLLENHLEPEIYSREGLERFLRECNYMGVLGQPVHIKLDTGMHRLGFEAGDVSWLKEKLSTGEILVRSIFTHLAASEDPSLDDFTRQQVDEFTKMAGQMKEITGEGTLLHMLNSAGIERFPEYQMDMVRVGIGLYGQGLGKGLEPVSTFRTIISQIRRVKSGETIGYGRSGKVKRDSLIATLPVGYADGINRHLGNGNYSFYVNGSYAPTIGHICMDMTMLDITGTGATIGDHVELFGRNCPVSEMAEQVGTIVYEVLTGIPERVKRVYIRE
ncbi:MAG: bifunctional UDP-N-acetylmuramoyl-tripeptide:D-alanyl-D-alanine ligase/alanine racemase [Bacteroidales bacterium]